MKQRPPCPELINNNEAQRVRKEYNTVMIKISKLMSYDEYYELKADFTQKLTDIPTTKT